MNFVSQSYEEESDGNIINKYWLTSNGKLNKKTFAILKVQGRLKRMNNIATIKEPRTR